MTLPTTTPLTASSLALSFSLALILTLGSGAPALASGPVTGEADRALCLQRGGSVQKGGPSGEICATPAKDAACAKSDGPQSAYDYRADACGQRSSEAGETSGGWTDVK